MIVSILYLCLLMVVYLLMMDLVFYPFLVALHLGLDSPQVVDVAVHVTVDVAVG